METELLAARTHEFIAFDLYLSTRENRRIECNLRIARPQKAFGCRIRGRLFSSRQCDSVWVGSRLWGAVCVFFRACRRCEKMQTWVGDAVDS